MPPPSVFPPASRRDLRSCQTVHARRRARPRPSSRASSSLGLSVSCLVLLALASGCGNRGELYLASDIDPNLERDLEPLVTDEVTGEDLERVRRARRARVDGEAIDDTLTGVAADSDTDDGGR